MTYRVIRIKILCNALHEMPFACSWLAQKLYHPLKTLSKAVICTRAGWDEATKAKQMLPLRGQIP